MGQKQSFKVNPTLGNIDIL